MEKIPTNLIIGFLGVGKTTAIRQLLKNKPTDERWAVIINEFGAVSIDHTFFEGTEKNGLMVKEVAGGCICCSANLPMQVTLNLVIKQQKPHRILIEPTGIGHPDSILDMLRSRFLKNVLEVCGTICLVDPRQWNQAKYREHETFIDQITLSDVLIANKTDLAGQVLTDEFLDWARSLFPPKIVIEAITQGNIKTEWLEIEPFLDRKALYPNAHQHEHHHHAEAEELIPTIGKPIRKESHGLERYGVGWVFSPDDVFDLRKLKSWVASLQNIDRMKGAFRTGKDWILLNAVGQEFTVEYLAYRRDSRLEVISSEPIAWQTLENGLMDCLLKNE